jgi:hypothetical protein
MLLDSWDWFAVHDWGLDFFAIILAGAKIVGTSFVLINCPHI